MSQFLGLHVAVTLGNGAELQGTVADINANAGTLVSQEATPGAQISRL